MTASMSKVRLNQQIFCSEADPTRVTTCHFSVISSAMKDGVQHVWSFLPNGETDWNIKATGLEGRPLLKNREVEIQNPPIHTWVTWDRRTKTDTSGYERELPLQKKRNLMLSAEAWSSSSRLWEKKEQPVEWLDEELRSPLSCVRQPTRPAGETTWGAFVCWSGLYTFTWCYSISSFDKLTVTDLAAVSNSTCRYHGDRGHHELPLLCATTLSFFFNCRTFWVMFVKESMSFRRCFCLL